MRKSDRKPLLDKLNALSPVQRQRLFQQAARLRKAEVNKNRNQRSDATRKYRHGHEDGDSFQKRGAQNKPVSLEDWALKLLAAGEFDLDEAASDEQVKTWSGRVISVKAGSCTVISEDFQSRIKCLLRPELTLAQRSDLAVGDLVQYSVSSDATAIIESVEPRSTMLSRPDPHDGRIERVIVTNIDIVVVVCALLDPPLNTNMIDRYLLAIERGGIKPLICVNKIDLANGDEKILSEMDTALEPYRQLGIDIVCCSADAGLGIDELRGKLMCKPAVFVGHSGVGKSSIINALEPSLELETRTVRRTTGKGRHTTVNSNLYHLPGDITIIDTPGVRSFGLWQMKPEELRWYFDEFNEFSPNCRFSNCSHTHEPQCAVKAAVEANPALQRRYESYLRMLETLDKSSGK